MGLGSTTTSVPSSSAVSDVSDHDTLSVSMASTTATDAVPPLTRATSTGTSSASSANTDQASSILGDGYILESQDGVLTLPSRYLADADLLCPFQILDCEHVFADIISFKTHVFSHFRGHELPTTANCFLCDNKYAQGPEDDMAFAWNTMLSHLVHEHFRQGQKLATVRTDFALMRWMFSRRLINEHQFKRTQMVPVPILLPSASNWRTQTLSIPRVPQAPSASPPPALVAHMARSVGYQSESYTVNAGRRAERRRLDATRTMVRAQTTYDPRSAAQRPSLERRSLSIVSAPLSVG
ncbi:hypothetical protein PV11_06142 [Exophiala sideris]|uniref:Uncharacterized protein n=1 Tax=Exophiala sideris TaxID=1016849 RepID=A0A0D1ZBP1_9EURO|nr:hypothetical protein PV11_06142 [Exophiala sideris]